MTNGTETTETPGVSWKQELITQLDWHWRTALRPKLEGLTDDEYLWEPVAGVWSLHPRGEAVTPQAAGGGDWVADIQFPEPDPAPLASIAWRLGHLSVGVLGIRASAHFGDGSLSYHNAIWPPTAAEALAYLDEQYAAWMTGLGRLSSEQLGRPAGPAEGPGASSPMAALILHINREVLHHGAEVLLLRDLYRTSDGGRAWLERPPVS
jgi:hypothetical protein